MVATGDLSNLLGDDVDQQQALLDNILLLSTSEGGLSRVMGDGEAGWEILVEFAFGRRFGWSEGGGEGIPKLPLQNEIDAPPPPPTRHPRHLDCGDGPQELLSSLLPRLCLKERGRGGREGGGREREKKKTRIFHACSCGGRAEVSCRTHDCSQANCVLSMRLHLI